MRFPLYVFHSRHFSQPQPRYEERFFISSIRVRLWGGNATRNEEMPGPCDVKLNEGNKGNENEEVGNSNSCCSPFCWLHFS